MKPIIIGADDVEAILCDRKTVVPIDIYPQPVLIRMSGCSTPILHMPHKGPLFPGSSDPTSIDVRWRFSPYKPGDVLWVRETWREFCGMFYGWQGGSYIPLDDISGYNFKSDDSHVFIKSVSPIISVFGDMKDDIEYGEWRPAGRMPKEAARLFLRVTDVEPKQIKNITDSDARMMGFRGGDFDYYSGYVSNSFDEFVKAWHKKYPKSSPTEWVWLIKFEKCSPE